jgi:all-trans-retinol 13,14-reductase
MSGATTAARSVTIRQQAEAYKMELKDRFPDHAAEIDAYFEALVSAEEATRMVAGERDTHRGWQSRWSAYAPG